MMRFNVSEVTGAIKDRRTIYPEQFSNRKVQKELIQILLDNARWAPSHKLTQPWRFKVFMDDGLKKFGEFHCETYKKVTPEKDFKILKYNKMKSRSEISSAIIAVCMKRDGKERVPELEEIASVSSAVQNMYITASAYGLGLYWGTGGLTFHESMKKFLGLNEKDICLGLIHVGYPSIDWPKPTPRKPLEYVTEWITE